MTLSISPIKISNYNNAQHNTLLFAGSEKTASASAIKPRGFKVPKFVKSLTAAGLMLFPIGLTQAEENPVITSIKIVDDSAVIGYKSATTGLLNLMYKPELDTNAWKKIENCMVLITNKEFFVSVPTNSAKGFYKLIKAF